MSSNFLRSSSSNDSFPTSPRLGNEKGNNLTGIAAATKTTVLPGARFQSSAKSPSKLDPQFRSAVLVADSPPLLDHFATSSKSRIKDVGLKPKGPVHSLSEGLYGSFLVAVAMKIWALPFLHPLEKSNAKFPKSSLQLVTDRLKAILRICSVHVIEFSNGDLSTTAFIKCQTMEQVEFVVVFWDIGNDTFCSEIQRLRGDTQTFWDHARRVIDTVNGKQISCPSDDPLWFDFEAASACDMVYRTIERRVLGRDHSVSAEDMKKAVEPLAEFLESDHYDKIGIALESLEAMTDPNMSGLIPARAVAEIVLASDGPMFRRLVDLIQAMGDDMLDFHANLALRVMAKSVGLVGKMERNRIAEQHQELIHWLEKSVNQGNPHVSYYSIHILSYFVNDGLVRDVAVQPQLEQFGSTSHAALANACLRLSDAIATSSSK